MDTNSRCKLQMHLKTELLTRECWCCFAFKYPLVVPPLWLMFSHRGSDTKLHQVREEIVEKRFSNAQRSLRVLTNKKIKTKKGVLRLFQSVLVTDCPWEEPKTIPLNCKGSTLTLLAEISWSWRRMNPFLKIASQPLKKQKMKILVKTKQCMKTEYSIKLECLIQCKSPFI